jgi:hypothetical protein
MNNLEQFFQKKLRLERETAEQAKQSAVQKAEQLIGNPSGNLPTGIPQNRKDEDTANRSLPLDLLRRRALFSGKKIVTTPSTGTGRKI